ncbi:MAG TPA: antibiotic biosynthesis monooxygenase [Acetobacteraceae bacterium]|jgi:heme-degrading monooxygenase HmoA
MFAVIFEVQPKSDRWDQYLGLAKQLRPELERIAGFIDNERFRSRRTEGRLLSLSIWADEKAVIRWRTHAMHHGVQEKGRFEVFEDYHLRVGEIAADTHLPRGQRLEQQRFDVTEVGAAKVISICEGDAVPEPPTHGVQDTELYESITTPGKLLRLVSWADAAAAEAWEQPPTVRHRRVRVIRDYGMSDRREAPQHFPGVPR